ncbi:hypothetical protein [Flavobacterium silvaticum]|uniref:Uncharacterized protein n=1 Tax=Flavobacterium silvaticum TaxID=1852020 RepID=A0A972FIW1_9FLAO|nr:hypothetical protein [Flavobacterium silvaticum]NMH26492.1 hypothetical protein [Flavobacterium silvaticum]
MKIFISIFLIFPFWTICAQQNIISDTSLNPANLSKELREIEITFKNFPPKVKVIETCSSKSELCGTMAFGSSSLVEILDGSYSKKQIYISTLCLETNYEVGKIYRIEITKSPSFGLGLCNDQFFDRNWNHESLKKPMIFGILKD